MQRRVEDGGATRSKRAVTIHAESTENSQPSATRKPQGRAGVADAWVHGASRGRPHKARRSVPYCAARRCPGRRRTDDARQRRSGTADEVAPRGICATWYAAALKGTRNLKRGVRSTVQRPPAFSGGAQHRGLSRGTMGAIDRTGGARLTRSARAEFPDLPGKRSRAVTGRCAEAHADDRG
jgi:hypothetical protein